MTSFFAVDPGGDCAGWAKFVDGRLVACGLLRSQEKDFRLRARDHRAALTALGAYGGPVLCECMRFRGRRGVGSPQILVELNLIAGHLGTLWIEPSQWKGMLSKELHQPRVWAELDAEEKAILDTVRPLSLRHNSTDAVGIGLWHLKRLTPNSNPSASAGLPSRRTSTAKAATSTSVSKKQPKRSSRSTSAARPLQVSRAIRALRKAS